MSEERQQGSEETREAREPGGDHLASREEMLEILAPSVGATGVLVIARPARSAAGQGI